MIGDARDDGTGEVRGAVVVMAKAPREGIAKTRLIGTYPAGDVVRLADCMLRDTVDLLLQLPRVHVAVMCPAEDVHLVAERVPAAAQVVGQQGQGLAAGLTSVFERFTPAFRRVVAVDSDSPHLPPAILQSALALLERNDVVVGPTEDGGYYLVGASAVHPDLFHPSPLGTASAREALVENARRLALSVAFTEPWYDVDLPDDLRRLAAELKVHPARAPRTAALLASWPLVPAAS